MTQVQAVYEEYVPHFFRNRPRTTSPTPEELPHVDWFLESLMTNEMGQHESHLALHYDRPTSMPSALTGGNARLDGASSYFRGSLLIADGAFEVPYGERDVVILWPEYMHAVIPPVAVHEGESESRRMSYLHYTRRGREPCPAVGTQIGEASEEEVAGWRRAA